MNWAEWAPTIVSMAAAVFIAGENRQTIREHGKRLDGHDAKLESHGQSITRMEAWKDGYNAASHRGNKEAI